MFPYLSACSPQLSGNIAKRLRLTASPQALLSFFSRGKKHLIRCRCAPPVPKAAPQTTKSNPTLAKSGRCARNPATADEQWVCSSTIFLRFSAQLLDRPSALEREALEWPSQTSAPDQRFDFQNSAVNTETRNPLGSNGASPLVSRPTKKLMRAMVRKGIPRNRPNLFRSHEKGGPGAVGDKNLVQYCNKIGLEFQPNRDALTSSKRSHRLGASQR